jgi:[amino group carrier protein]-lysine/ornithine hydrolase
VTLPPAPLRGSPLTPEALSGPAVDLLRRLLEAYSPSGQEGEAAACLVQAMRELGFTAGLDPAGNPTGVLGDGPRQILLLGHIDTVPGSIPVRPEDGALYGRGAVDAKGPLACFVMAAALAGARPGWQLRVVGALGEEADSPGARWLAQNTSAPEMVFIGEPSGWQRLTLGYKGSAWLRFTVQQPLAHTAGQAPSACELAVAFWNGVVELAAHLNQGQERLFDQLTPTLRGMDSASDGFTETAGLNIGLRLPPSLAPDRLPTLLAPLAGAGSLEIHSAVPAYRGEKNTPQVRSLLAAIRSRGGTPGFSLKTGTSDMNVVGPAWGCPILAYGPGDSSLDHTPNEHIQIAEYLESIHILAAALTRLMEPAA